MTTQQLREKGDVVRPDGTGWQNKNRALEPNIDNVRGEVTGRGGAEHR